MFTISNGKNVTLKHTSLGLGLHSMTGMKNPVNILHLLSHPRSSHQRCSVKKGVLRNFAKFTGKYLCQCLFFNKVAGLRPAKFCEISKNFFFKNTFGQLVLSFVSYDMVYRIETAQGKL